MSNFPLSVKNHAWFFFALDQKHRKLFAQIRNQRIVGIQVITLFGVFFCRHCMANFRFHGEQKYTTTNFSFSFWICRWFLRIQLQETCQCLMKWESWNNHADVSRNAKSLCKQRFLPPSPSWHLNIPNDLERVRRSECTAEGIFPFFLPPASWQVKWVCLSWVDYFVVVWSSTVTLSHVLIYFRNKHSSHTYHSQA